MARRKFDDEDEWGRDDRDDRGRYSQKEDWRRKRRDRDQARDSYMFARDEE